MLSRSLVPLLLLSLATACSTPAGPAEDEGLSVRSRPPFLDLTSRATGPIFFTALEREFLETALWGPCLDPEICPRLDAGGRTTLAYEEIDGYVPGKTEAVVYWWRLLPNPDGTFRADSVRALVVPL